ncbi:threonine-phosphate decarboxylase CobD [Thauera sp. WH-1]|uniref:threonine-phosphate decarboxylase CobD n=1 Tax=Thauera sp. WH-1 TaxID=3398230 RepID=UPI0039FC61D0
MLEHGGRLRRAAAHYGIALGDWLDLSTGINPEAYPVPPIPLAAWQRLPEDDDGLEAAAASYYGSASLLPVAGSQAAIQALPGVLAELVSTHRPAPRVSLLAPSYAEHAQAWRAHGPALFAAEDADRAVARSDIVVLVQPNNPTGVQFERARLLAWHQQLAARGGWLVIDEAFIDPTPAASLAPLAGADGLVVLRSLGKFFGLAGARVGFVLAPAAVRERLAAKLGPWTVSGPARHVSRAALLDRAWQAHACRKLQAGGARLARVLGAAGLAPVHGPALFKWWPSTQAAALHAALARRGILTRLFDAPAALRFGLPREEADWQRFQHALHAALAEIGPSPALPVRR